MLSSQFYMYFRIVLCSNHFKQWKQRMKQLKNVEKLYLFITSIYWKT